MQTPPIPLGAVAQERVLAAVVLVALLDHAKSVAVAVEIRRFLVVVVWQSSRLWQFVGSDRI